jgi:Cytidine and deoxycytidylate deaminase zinc-binding region.
MIGPCTKQVVTATIVTPDGRRFVGTNYVRNHQLVCPREGMPSGHGYELCRDVCHQVGHAEVVAIAEAGEQAAGATLYLEGHTYACAPCKAAAAGAGIVEIVISSPPEQA